MGEYLDGCVVDEGTDGWVGWCIVGWMGKQLEK